MRVTKTKCLLLISFFLLLQAPMLHATDQEEPGTTTLFSHYHLLAQEILYQLTPFNLTPVFGAGLGGSLVYETYVLNRLFRVRPALPGLVLGLTGTLFAFLPGDDTSGLFGDSTLMNMGAYLGYQFYLPASAGFAFSPALTAGARYYFSFHYYNNNLNITSNPIITGSVNLNFILQQQTNLCLSAEYELFYESEPVHTLQLALRTGFFY